MKKTLLLLTMTTLFLTSCGEKKNNDKVVGKETIQKQENQKEKEDKEREKQKEKEIDQLKYYLKNENTEVTDENGISYKLKVNKKIISQENMYTSEKMYVTEGDIGFDKYVVVSSYRIKTLFELKTNGKSINNIELEGFLVKSQLNGKERSNVWDEDLNKWVVKTRQNVVMLRNMSCNDKIIYYPAIHTKEYRKKNITKFTSAWCDFGFGNDVKNAKIEALNKSGILKNNLKNIQYTTKSIIDINNIFKFIDTKNHTKEIKENQLNNSSYNTVLKTTVDNLRVRRSPELDSEKIENLAIGSKVEFLEKSNNQTTVTIKNKEITEYWYKVKTPSGKIGWIHGCCFDK